MACGVVRALWCVCGVVFVVYSVLLQRAWVYVACVQCREVYDVVCYSVVLFGTFLNQ